MAPLPSLPRHHGRCEPPFPLPQPAKSRQNSAPDQSTAPCAQEQMVSFAATEPNIRVQKPHLVQAGAVQVCMREAMVVTWRIGCRLEEVEVPIIIHSLDGKQKHTCATPGSGQFMKIPCFALKRPLLVRRRDFQADHFLEQRVKSHPGREKKKPSTVSSSGSLLFVLVGVADAFRS